MADAPTEAIRRPDFYLAAYGVTAPATLWLLAHGGLNDYRSKGRRPHRRDLLYRDAEQRRLLRILPSRPRPRKGPILK